MAKRKDILDKLIYLDPDFISSKYEEIKGISPTTQFTKTEGMKADGGFPFLSAGVHTQETKTFKLSSIQMFDAIRDKLESYPNFQPENFRNYQGTQTVWIEGELTMGEWRVPDDLSSSSEKYFEFKSGKVHYSFIVQPENFSSNIGALLTISSALRSNIGIPVKVLARILYLVEKIPSFVACPYLIFER
jgi:hypothetical protein